MNKVRWGIIGAGNIAQRFARDIQFCRNAELLAVASRSHEKSKTFADNFGIASCYGDYASLYEAQNIDAIYIATPHTQHLENCLDSLKHGKAVLCEKPLVINPKECEALIQATMQGSEFIMEALWTAFLPAIKQALNWYQAGEIGRIRHIRADFGHPIRYGPELRAYNKTLAGGCLLDMGIYPVALAWLFLQSQASQIQTITRFADNGVEDDISIQADINGTTVNLAASFRVRLANWAFIIGDKGHIAIPDFVGAKEAMLYRGDELIEHFSDPRQGSGFEYEIEHASDHILNANKQSNIFPLTHSLELQKFIANIFQKISD